MHFSFSFLNSRLAQRFIERRYETATSDFNEAEFDARFNGAAYRDLKAKYDPGCLAPTLYDKVAMQPD
jgi:hypothetical protein